MINARAGTNYLLARQQPQSATNKDKDVYASRISPDGIVLDPEGIAIVQDKKRDGAQSVACGGGVCLVVWRAGIYDVRARRVEPDGTVLDPGGIVLGAIDGLIPETAVTYDGEAFLATWRTMGGDVRGARVSLDGELLDAGDFLIATATGAPTDIATASDGAGHRLVLYDRFDRSPAYRIRRVRTRVVADE